MNKLPKLYKKTSKGKILEWEISSESNVVTTVRGEIGTEKPQTETVSNIY